MDILPKVVLPSGFPGSIAKFVTGGSESFIIKLFFSLVLIAMSVYAYIAILRQPNRREHLNLWNIAPVMSLTCFDKMRKKSVL